jgi:hypothetical protein
MSTLLLNARLRVQKTPPAISAPIKIRDIPIRTAGGLSESGWMAILIITLTFDLLQAIYLIVLGYQRSSQQSCGYAPEKRDGPVDSVIHSRLK